MVERMAEEIADHFYVRFGWSVYDTTPIDKGWLNVKWKMETDNGLIFVKFYHPERYKLHIRPERRNAMEKTLQLQYGLSDAGVPCPKVYPYQGQYIQETPSGLLYTVMNWTDGYTAEAGSLSSAQMYDLGAAAGRMHKWLRSVPPLDKSAWQPNKDAYLQEWQGNWDKAQEAGDTIVLEWLERSKAIVEVMDFSVFESFAPAWLHWDLWVDNIVLHDRGVAGIVDFDRMTMAYQEIDVARAILSGALRDGQLRVDEVRAFMDGYRDFMDVQPGMLSRSLCMLYLIESIWWLRTEIRVDSELRGLLRRFVEEMHWIEDNRATLADQLDNL